MPARAHSWRWPTAAPKAVRRTALGCRRRPPTQEAALCWLAIPASHLVPSDRCRRTNGVETASLTLLHCLDPDRTCSCILEARRERGGPGDPPLKHPSHINPHHLRVKPAVETVRRRSLNAYVVEAVVVEQIQFAHRRVVLRFILQPTKDIT